MPKRSAVQLIDALDWRLKTLRYLNLYASSEDGELSAEEIRTCMGLMLIEIENIVARKENVSSGGRNGSDGPRA